MENKTQKDADRRTLSKIMLKQFVRSSPPHRLPFINVDGESPVLVVLPEDTCQDVVSWALETGGANVFTMHNSRITVFTLDPSKFQPVNGENGSALPVSPDSHIGLLLDWLDQHPEQGASISVTSDKTVPVSQARPLQTT